MNVHKTSKYSYAFATMAWTRGRKPGKNYLKKVAALSRYKSKIGSDFSAQERKAIILNSHKIMADIVMPDKLPLNTKKERIYINRYRFGKGRMA